MREMKKILAILGALVTVALGLAVFLPHAAEAGWQMN
jgi:hypothetical protein